MRNASFTVTFQGKGFTRESASNTVRSTMENKHWGMLIIVLLLGYFIGAKFPSTGTSLLAKVGV